MITGLLGVAVLVEGACDSSAIGTEGATTVQEAPTSTIGTLPPQVTMPSTTAPAAEQCVVVVKAGDSIFAIAKKADQTQQALLTANQITDPTKLQLGTKIDICPTNGIDDRTGRKIAPAPPTTTAKPKPAPSTTAAAHPATTRPRPTVPTTRPPVAVPTGTKALQNRLNQLEVPLGMHAIAVDGDPGPVTDRAACAAEWLLGHMYSRADVAAGSTMEKAIMTEHIKLPPQVPFADRWAIVNQTCQVMLVGNGPHMRYLFPISSGKALTATDDGTYHASRYDPAVANKGWHDSTKFPVSQDSKLLGNMYKPIYFDSGKAIHGSTNVPPNPASHGCVRMEPDKQDILVRWEGLDKVTTELSGTKAVKLLDLTVVVIGAY